MRNGLLTLLSFLTGFSRCLAQAPAAPTAPAIECPPVTSIIDESGTTPNAPGARAWIRAEYLHWWIKDSSLPPLVTTGSGPIPGALGQPGTVVLFGGSDFDHGDFSGGRVSVGGWLGGCHSCGVELRLFALQKERNDEDFFGGVLARPFFNVNQGIPFVELISVPGQASGGLHITNSSELSGAELNIFRCLCSGCGYQTRGFAGFRYLDLDEELNITEVTTLAANVEVPPPLVPGATYIVSDRFSTRNRFYGGQVGATAEWQRGPWFIDLRGSIALGVTRQEIDISGSQVRIDPNGAATAFRGGLLALPSNIGRFERDRFSVVPEFNINVGYEIVSGVRVFVGYSFLYWTNVVRPGDQIDLLIDVTQIPNFPVAGVTPTGLGRPAVPFKESDFWAQGFNLGLELRW